MNAVEIERAISELVEQPYDAVEFPYQFLAAFGNKETTLTRLRSGSSNKSDIPGAVLQRNNIHIATCPEGEVYSILSALKDSLQSTKAKVKFVLATDGVELQAENIISDTPLFCDYRDFPNNFGFFLPLAGITTVKEISDNPIDIRATSRLNQLYIELLKENEDWASDAKRHDMNQFMAQLVFCFFAEDTGIFSRGNIFTNTIEQMSDSRSGNTDFVIGELFRAMDIPKEKRAAAKLPPWADAFPYANGGLFAGARGVPKFSRSARNYLLHVGKLNWKEINPDIFGSMIQAVADDEERGSLGMHYTSVPNILKVLNPLFLDDLRKQLGKAGDNNHKLLNLRKRMSRIRVFDPACGSGNFLVIAYKQMRAIEATINKKLGKSKTKSEIPINNFRGIEIRDFPAEIARLALIIAEYQCDEKYLDQNLALAELLPLDRNNWIVYGNALRLDWLSICPPTETGVRHVSDDLLRTPQEPNEIDFKNEGGETYICSNPPYLGSTWQSAEQKDELKAIFNNRTTKWKSLDYVAGWFIKAVDYGKHTTTTSAFVSTNSICQGQQVPILWPLIFNAGHEIAFAHTSFKWANLARHNAGVTVAIVGISNNLPKERYLFCTDAKDSIIVKETNYINAYLVAGKKVFVERAPKPLNGLSMMAYGNKPVDGGNLLLSKYELTQLNLSEKERKRFIRFFYGSAEFIRGLKRYCIWIKDEYLPQATKIKAIKERIDKVREVRLKSKDAGANEMANRAHQFREMNSSDSHIIIVPAVSSENRKYLPVGLLDNAAVISNRNFALYDAPLWNMALIASRLHWVWIATVCGKLEMRFNYSNTLGWNTFSVPKLTEKNRQDLTHCAEDILLAREVHFPATIADLYDSDEMPDNLRHAHEHNDEVLERIYIGRRFKNDTERLEKLFDLYTKMTSPTPPSNNPKTKENRL